MRKFYITGVSGTGKSSVAERLNVKGIPSIDLDAVKGLCKWVNNDTSEISHWQPGIGTEFFEKHKYICDKEKLFSLINDHKDKDVVVVGLVDNQSEFLNLFDKVFLFHCNEETFFKRINERINNDFGKHDSEQKMIMGWYKDFEKEMIDKGAIAINTEESLDAIVDTVVRNINS